MHGVGHLRGIVWVCSRVHREELVVAQGEDLAFREEACMMYGAMVDDLHEGFVFVGNCCVVDVY
jgi:hypothetical protein